MDVPGFDVNELIDSMEKSELTHYGRKGMKWGVRRSRKQLGRGKSDDEKKPNKMGDAITVSKKGGRFQKVDIEDENGKVHRVVVNTKTKNIRGRAADAIEKERVELLLKEFGTEGLSNDKLRAYSARVELEKKINTLNPPPQNPAKKFVKDMLAGDRDKVLASGDVTKTTTYMLGAAALSLAGAQVKKNKAKKSGDKSGDDG